VVEIWEGPVVGDDLGDAVESGVQLEFIDRAVGFVAGEGGHFAQEGVELLFYFFRIPRRLLFCPQTL